MNQIAINDVGTAEDFMAAIDATMKYYQTGDIVSGTIVQVGRDGVLVDIGYKTEAFVPKNEVSIDRDFDIYEIAEIGQLVKGTVLNQDEEGNLILSLKEGKLEHLWDTLQFKYEISDPIRGQIIKAVKGGLIVDIGIRAFLPGSLVDVKRVDDFSAYIGQEYDFIINSMDRGKGNIVLNRRTLLEKSLKEDMNVEFAKLSIGETYQGIISGITDYGVFIEIGLLSGLVHKSKMGNFTPEQFTVGHAVDVEIIDIDFEKSRLSLALRG